MNQYKRETAYKVTIKDLAEGEYVVQEGWNPNYVIVGEKKVSRANVLAVVSGEEEGMFTIEDGTGNIHVRTFEDPLQLEVGKMYVFIGKARDYQGVRYLVPEIAKEIEDTTWAEVRKKEIQPTVQEKKEEKEEPTNEPLLDLIQQLDEGDGVRVEVLEKKTGPCEKMITALIEQGEIFEIKPGIVKIL